MRPLFYFLLVSLLGSISTVSAQSEIKIEKVNDNLNIYSLSDSVFVVEHKYPWPCNSMIALIGDSNLLMVDTPCTPEATVTVLDWAEEKFGDREVTAINSHYHVDCLGGNRALIEKGIEIYGSDLTVELIEKIGNPSDPSAFDNVRDEAIRKYHQTFKPVAPTTIFPLIEGKTVKIGNSEIEIFFPGHAHSPDNVVIYLKDQKVLFAGCMLRAYPGMGNMNEANPESWLKAVDSIKRFDAQFVIPGHGGANFNFSPDLINFTKDQVEGYINKQ
jgi:metallo-beta-lactamase class B